MMMEETFPINISNRQALEERLLGFQALADFANTRDTPEDWKKFRLMWPDILTPWFYEVSAISADLEEMMGPGGPVIVRFRDMLRNVWNQNDPHAFDLKFLLGFETSSIAEKIAAMDAHRGVAPAAGYPRVAGFWTNFPPPKPAKVDWKTGQITWEFGTQFQRAVYALTQESWRAKVCPVCRKYFIADKSATQHCSPKCYGVKKAAAQLDYYHRVGKFERRKARAKSKHNGREEQ